MVDKALKGALEDNILTLLCWSDRHAPALAMELKPELFSTKVYREIATASIAHLERYSVAPKGHLRDLFEAHLRKGEEGKLFWKTFDAMEALQADIQPDYVMAQLERFISLRRFTMAVEEAADRLHNGELEEAREAIYTQSHSAPMATLGIWLSDPKSALSFLDERDEDYFSSGVDILDEMGVRPARKTLTVLIAPAKKGKSWFLVGVGKAALLNQTSVLHITLENSEELTAKRYVQALYGMTSEKAETIKIPMFRRDQMGRCQSIDYDTISPDVLNAAARPSVAKKLKKLRGKLLIKEFPTGTLTFPQLNAYLDYLARVVNFVPDMLIIDYPNLMAIDAGNLRIDLGRAFTQLRGVAVSRNMAVVAVTQGNRTASTSKTVGSNQVAEDYSIVGTADTVLTYSQTGDERQLNLARILVAAARGVKDMWVALISQSYASGQFSLDSVYMHKHVEAEVKRLTTGEIDESSDE